MLLSVGSFVWLIILALILIALIAILIVLCFFKYKQIRNKETQANGKGRDEEMAEAHQLEEMTRNREHDEMLPEGEKVVDEKAVSLVFPGDEHLAADGAKAAEANGLGAGLAPLSEGKGPIGTGGSQSVLNLNLAMPKWGGCEPPHHPVPQKPQKNDEMQGSCGQLVSPPPAEQPPPPFPPSVMPTPPISSPPTSDEKAYSETPLLQAAPGGYYPIETQEPSAVAPHMQPKAPLPHPNAPNNGPSPNYF